MIVAGELSDQAADARQLEPALEQLDENLEAIERRVPDGRGADRGRRLLLRGRTSRLTSEHGLDPYIATGRFKHSEPPPPAPRGPIPKDATPKQRMARKLRTKKGRAIYSRRKAIVEPVFGQIGTVQDGRRVLLRGKQAARAQWRFHCAIHNLLKLHRAGGLDLISELNTAQPRSGEASPPHSRPSLAPPRPASRAHLPPTFSGMRRSPLPTHAPRFLLRSQELHLGLWFQARRRGQSAF